MKVAFKDESFAFEFVRNLGFTYYGGADIGEMLGAAGRIEEGDFESWFTEWDTSEDGAEKHCQSGALAYKDEVLFNWLDETLRLHDDRKD